MPIWDALCDPATDGASLRALVRAALTWRLFDRALLIAVVYPIVLLVGVWLVTGQDARLGGQVVLDGPGLWVVWPDRATVLGAFVVLAAGFIGRRLPTGCRFSH